MRALVQRVSQASVTVSGETRASIGPGLVIFLGIGPEDGDAQLNYLVEKIAHLRIFGDEAGKINLSLLDLGAEAIVVSQFTLYADTRKGRRPSFTGAAPPALAEPLVQAFVEAMNQIGVPTQTGVFGAEMKVALINDGPVTLWLERN